jgi:hypothetical protein
MGLELWARPSKSPPDLVVPGLHSGHVEIQFLEHIFKQETIKNRMISLFKSSPIYIIISSTKFLIDRAQSLIILETRSPVNFVAK